MVDKVIAYNAEETLIEEMGKIGVPFKFFTIQNEGELNGTTTKFTKLDGKSETIKG